MRISLLFILLAVATPAAAQTRIDQIAAEFTKMKNHTKTKYGVSTKKFREMISEPWQVGSVRAYAGRYESLGDPMQLEVQFNAAGAISARGSDPDPFELRDAQIADGVLTGTKVYSDGRRAPFEGGFLKRSDRAAPGEPLTVRYGIGTLVDAPENTGIVGTIHVFLAKQ